MDGIGIYMLRLLLLVCLSFVASCSQGERVDLLNDYLDRLANVVGTDRVESEHFMSLYHSLSPSFRFPDSEQAIYDAQGDHSIGLLDFLSLYGCRLQTLVAERNSNLGKLAKPSQQLLYELQFLKYSSECAEQLKREGSSELAEQLLMVSEQKKRDLPKHVWRTILNGDEAKTFWKRTHSLGAYPDKDSINVLSSLNFLEKHSRNWLRGHFSEGNSMLEQHLASLNQPEGGALLKSFLLYSLALEEANKLLDRVSLCQNGRAMFNEIAAHNVVTRFFIGGVQAWVSQLSQRYYTVMPAYRSLEQQLNAAESDEYRLWRNLRDTQFENMIDASKAHVQRLEVLLGGCSERVSKQ